MRPLSTYTGWTSTRCPCAGDLESRRQVSVTPQLGDFPFTCMQGIDVVFDASRPLRPLWLVSHRHISRPEASGYSVQFPIVHEGPSFPMPSSRIRICACCHQCTQTKVSLKLASTVGRETYRRIFQNVPDHPSINGRLSE